jgi:hypothetical protein
MLVPLIQHLELSSHETERPSKTHPLRMVCSHSAAAAAAAAPATVCTDDSSTLELPLQETDPLAFDVLGIALLHLAGHFVVFGAAAVLLDSGLLQQLKRLRNRSKHRIEGTATLYASEAAAATLSGNDKGNDKINTQRQRDEPAEGKGIGCDSSAQQAMVSIISSYAWLLDCASMSCCKLSTAAVTVCYEADQHASEG